LELSDEQLPAVGGKVRGPPARSARSEPLVGGGDGPRGFYGLGQAAANWPKDKRRDLAFGSEGEIGSAAGKFGPVIEL
jgi:hypothetical protein